MKKAKVTKVTKMDKKDDYGNTSFIVELDNADKGFYVSKNENQTKFVVGQESEYNIEEKQGKKGVYYKITIPQSDKPSFGGGKQQQDPRVQFIGYAMSYAKDLVIADKIKIDSLAVQFDIIYNEMISKI